MNQAAFEEEYQHVLTNRRQDDEDKQATTAASRPLLRSVLWSKILASLPILAWLPKYSLKNDLYPDAIAGITVGIMAVPQGMAYASLAGIPPIYGLYSSFFAPFFYFFLGTSKHVAIGVFAVVSMMVNNLILNFREMHPDVSWPLQNHSVSVENGNPEVFSGFSFEVDSITLISSLTFTVALIQIGMGIMRLSFLTTYMSDQLVSGYMAGSACHVFVAQLSKVTGVSLPHYSGFFMLQKMIFDFFKSLPRANLPTVILSIIGLAFLSFTRQFVAPLVAKRCRVPVPFELILVIIVTIFSSIYDFKHDLKIKIVDHITRGIPGPRLPEVRIIPYIWVDAVSIAIICYLFLISMAKLYAKKHKYKIDPNQELFALGFSSLFSSFFPTYPTGASLSRSSVCEMSGARSQVYVLFTTSLLLVVILWLGPFLEPLPMCILACIVIVSLKNLFLHFRELPRLWRVSKHDFLIWIVSCVSTFLSDPTIGILVSFAFAMFTVSIRMQWPLIEQLYADSHRRVFKTRSVYTGLTPVNDRVTILKFGGPMFFFNSEVFTEQIAQLIDNDSLLQIATEKSALAANEKDPSVQMNDIASKQRLLIIDASAISCIDTMGVEALCSAYRQAEATGYFFVLADVNEYVLHALRQPEFRKILPYDHIYPSVLEALIAHKCI